MVNGGKTLARPLSSASPFHMEVSTILLFTGSMLDEELLGLVIALGSLEYSRCKKGASSEFVCAKVQRIPFLQHLRQLEHVPEDFNLREHFFLSLGHFMKDIRSLLV